MRRQKQVSMARRRKNTSGTGRTGNCRGRKGIERLNRANKCSEAALTTGGAAQSGKVPAIARGNGRPAVCQIVGYKNSGKTTLICDLIPHLRKLGCTVAVIKHDGHNFDVDHEGTDTWKQRQAGASAVAITSGTRTTVIREQASSLSGLLAAFAGYDYVLVEGFKQEQYPKIVLVRREADIALLSEAQHIVAMAVWDSIPDTQGLLQMPGIDRFDINDSAGIAGFLWRQRFYFQNFII